MMVVVPQTLLTPVTKEVLADMASGSAWINRIPHKLSWTGVKGSTTGDICNDVSVKHALSLVLIEIVTNYPTCGLNKSLKVSNKRHSSSPGLVGQTPKLDAVVDGKFPNDLNYASILSKVTGYKLSDGSSGDLYTRCRINFTGDSIQT